ncbi:MAG: hemolysin family protein [Pseudomonadota bacterium]
MDEMNEDKQPAAEAVKTTEVVPPREEPPEDPAEQRGFFARLLNFSGTENDKDANGHEVGATADEQLLLSNIRTMRGQRVVDIMIPRTDIVAIEQTATLTELTEAFRLGSHSRMPVYRETLDDPVGFIHVKDVALARGFGTDAKTPFKVEDFTRDMLVVPESMQTGRLLQRMQQSRIHMALVVDEYGGVDGLVTIEDLVEQIVGDIEDEHDEAGTIAWRREAPGIYVANARAELDDFEEDAGVDLLPDDLDEDVDTLGGLVFMLSNRVPERGEVIAHPDGHEFEVIDADPRKIKRLRVRLRTDTIAPAPAVKAAE